MIRRFRPRRAAAAALAGAALALGGCSPGGQDGEESSAPASTERERVQTTRVQVVEDLGKKGFHPAEIYRRLAPGVVTVISIFERGATGLLDRDGGAGQGSGFILDSDGHVATNAHVVTTGNPPRTKRAKEVFVQFGDGNRVEAKIVGDDPNSDVALLKIDPKGLDLTPLELGDSEHLRVADPVVAIGSPFGEAQSLSVGVVSALDRDIEGLTQFAIGNVIQTDAAINPGNSGGPLLDAEGKVVGINAQIETRSGTSSGVGFAVPAESVKRSIEGLREDGKVEYGFLGVTSQELYPQLARHLDLAETSGALVVGVEDGSPADEAGLSAGKEKTEFQGLDDIPRDGDVILAVEGRKLRGPDNLADLIAHRPPGDEVKLRLLRGDDTRTVTVTLAKRPERAPENPLR